MYRWKGIQVNIFTVAQRVLISLKYALTQFALFMSSRFHDIAIQNLKFAFYFSVSILSVLWKKISFRKAGLHWLKGS